MKITLVLERDGDNYWWATADTPGIFIATGADNIEGIRKNVLDLIEDHQAHDGATQPEWQGVTPDTIIWEYTYDLIEVFQAYPEVSPTQLARVMKMNESLIRQYVSGAKYPSAKVAQRIETALRDLGNRLVSVNISIAEVEVV
jgi:hypothetical protein